MCISNNQLPHVNPQSKWHIWILNLGRLLLAKIHPKCWICYLFFLRLLIFLGDLSNTIDKLTTQKHVISVTKRYTKYLLNIYVSPPHRIVYNERGLNVLSLKLENIDVVLPMPGMAQLNKEPFPSDTMHVNWWKKSMILIEFSQQDNWFCYGCWWEIIWLQSINLVKTTLWPK